MDTPHCLSAAGAQRPTLNPSQVPNEQKEKRTLLMESLMNGSFGSRVVCRRFRLAGHSLRAVCVQPARLSYFTILPAGYSRRIEDSTIRAVGGVARRASRLVAG
jgi:hypothetical protein